MCDINGPGRGHPGPWGKFAGRGADRAKSWNGGLTNKAVPAMVPPMKEPVDLPVEKTTVYLVSSDYRRIKALARSEGRSAADLVREAVALYVARRGTGARPASVGIGRSGRGDLSERAEDLLAEMPRHP